MLGEKPEAVERPPLDPIRAFWKRGVFRSPDGKRTIEFLRHQSWLEQYDVAIGSRMDFRFREALVGDLEVVAVEPCPPFQEGRGHVVTGRYVTRAARVLDVHVEGLAEPIGTTPNHPFWSEDRATFVRADELQPGERLRTLCDDTACVSDTAGSTSPRGPPTARVLRITERPGTHAVYNLEVQLHHTYHVARSGLFVHNALSCSQRLLKSLRKNSFVDSAGNVVKVDPKVAREIAESADDAAETLQTLNFGRWAPRQVNTPSHQQHIVDMGFSGNRDYTKAASELGRKADNVLTYQVGNLIYRYDEDMSRILIVDADRRRIVTFYDAHNGMDTFIEAITNGALDLTRKGKI